MVTIRPEQPADEDVIRDVLMSAFPTSAEADLVDALRAAEKLSASLVAVSAGRMMGHVAFSPVIVAGATDGLGLAPVAVRPADQRRGIGGRLIVEGLAACGRNGAGFVVLLGDPAYYRRFGFATAADWGLRDEYGGGPAFQAIELRAGAIPRGAGLVRYAAEFAIGAEGTDA